MQKRGGGLGGEGSKETLTLQSAIQESFGQAQGLSSKGRQSPMGGVLGLVGVGYHQHPLCAQRLAGGSVSLWGEPQFIHSPAAGHVHYFQFGAITKFL